MVASPVPEATAQAPFKTAGSVAQPDTSLVIQNEFAANMSRI
jgi:hypothetical protein